MFKTLWNRFLDYLASKIEARIQYCNQRDSYLKKNKSKYTKMCAEALFLGLPKPTADEFYSIHNSSNTYAHLTKTH
jgi:hypothetical protein